MDLDRRKHSDAGRSDCGDVVDMSCYATYQMLMRMSAFGMSE